MPQITTPNNKQIMMILGIYNIYRVVLALILLLSFIYGAKDFILGNNNPDLYLTASLAYAVVNILILILHTFFLKSFGTKTSHVVALITTDIIAITTLSYSCGGVISGLGNFLLVTVAAGSILISGRISTFFAAIASISLIYAEIYIAISGSLPGPHYLQAGLLGAVLFATSLVMQNFSGRIRASENLANQQATNIVDLEKLNRLVIQRMHTGIVVIDANEKILTLNRSAKRLLSLGRQQNGKNSPGFSQELTQELTQELPQELTAQLKQWKENPNVRTAPFRFSPSSPRIQAKFSLLNPKADSNILIFLENDTQINQRVQQLKLVSLGRLTASIAHEVRNPLGAISHASQLLKESDNLNQQDGEDRRLIEIILAHSKRVNTIIENILALSRHRENLPEKMLLKPWLQQFIERYVTSQEQDVLISLNISPEETIVRINASQLEQVLSNLFDNGLRYSLQETGVASLSLQGGTSKDGQMTFVNIIDDGPGVSADVVEHLFEPFYTSDSTGSGLGLYISKELCDANQAQLIHTTTASGKNCFSINFTQADRDVSWLS